MPTYAAAGFLGGILALGVLIYTIWTYEPPHVGGGSGSGRSDFDPGPGYDRPRDWGTE